MKIRSLNQFMQWYLNTADDELIRRIYADLTGGDEELEVDKKSRQELWERFKSKYWGKRITEVLQEEHEEVIEEVKSREREELRTELDKLEEQYGLRGLSFALIVNPDKYTQEMGFEFLNDKPNESLSPPPAMPPPPITYKRKKKAAPFKTRKNTQLKMDISDILDETIDNVANGKIDFDIAKIKDKLQSLLEALDEHENRNKVWMQYEQSFILVLKALEASLEEVLSFLGLDAITLFDLRLIRTISPDKWPVMLEALQGLEQNCAEVTQRMVPQPANMQEMKDNYDRLQVLKEEIEKYRGIIDECGIFVIDITDNDSDEILEAEQTRDKYEHEDEEEEESEAYETDDSRNDFQKTDETWPTAAPETLATNQDEASNNLEEIQVPTHSQESPDIDKTPQENTLEHSPSEGQETNPPLNVLVTTEESTPEAQKDKETTTELPESSFAQGQTGEEATDGTTPGPYNEAIWAMLSKPDLPTAYWLAREYDDKVEPQENETIIPSYVLLASWLSEQNRWNEPEIITRMHNICYEHPEPGKELYDLIDQSHYALACWLTAIAAPAVLQAPSTLSLGWLEEAHAQLKNSNSHLFKMLDAIRNYAISGQAINPVYLQEALQTKDWQTSCKQAATNVTRWREMAGKRRIEYKPAVEVYKYLAGDQSPFTEIFKLLENDDYSRAEETLTLINSLCDRKRIESLIHSTIRELYDSGSARPIIHGRANEQLIRLLEELRSSLLEWYTGAKFSLSISESNNWLRQQTEQLVKTLQELWPLVQVEMQESRTQARDNNRQHKMVIIDLSLYLLNRLMTFLVGHPSYPSYPATWYGLGAPLLLLKDSPLQEGQTINIDDSFQPVEPLLAAIQEGRTLEQAVALHIALKDLLLLEMVLQQMGTEGISEADIKNDLPNYQLEWQRLVKRRWEDVRDQLEQARIDHVVSEEDYTVFDGILLSIEHSNSQRYGQILIVLDNTESQLKELREARLLSLGTIIDEIRSQLLSHEEGLITSDSSYQKALQYLDKAEEYLSDGQLPLADEYIRFAERVIETGQVQDIDQKDAPSYIDEFVQVLPGLYEYLEKERATWAVMQQLAKGKSFAGLDMSKVRKKQLDEVIAAMEAWRKLKSANEIIRHKAIEANLAQILQYLGFNHPTIKQLAQDNNSIHYAVEMAAPSSCPLPEFGSQAGGYYDVVVIAGRPPIGRIGHLLDSYGLKGKHPIIIYLGRVTMLQRQEWSSYCYQEKLTALLIDELLLYYLATQRDDRLPAAISCSIAWGYAVPYRSFGVIPPELFKGRREMISQLGTAGGACIVYGGRQLGKSVLLRSVQHKYHHPDLETYVLYEDIRNLGDPQSVQDNDKSRLWLLLRQQMITSNLLPDHCPEDPDSIMEAVKKMMEKYPNRRIILLLDEADSFLNADAITNFEDVNRLRRLMDDTKRNFKVVLCGLHGVQRYCSGENHPFAQMMDKPVVVGPLEPLSATMLIEQPMSAVGFSFSSEESHRAVLRILSYTNYHPALIQHFCAEIIKLVRKKQHQPPYRVTVSDVEAIYRQEEVRRVMNERFQWTLALDTRYETIVYSMIEEQYQERDGFRREFSASEVLEYCRLWWPEGFASLALEELKALLEELIGLGILVKRSSGLYRLRNANVVRGLGSEREIEEKLLLISQRHPDGIFQHNSQLRMVLEPETGRRSPLSIAQANSLTRYKPGVGMVFGSKALGLELVPDTLKQIIAAEAPRAGMRYRVVELPPERVSDIQVLEYLNRLVRKDISERVLVYAYASHLDWQMIKLPQMLTEIAEMVKRVGKRHPQVRFILLMDAQSTHKWLLDSSYDKAEIDTESICRLGPWDAYNIRSFLSSREMLDSEEVVKTVLAGTGGWPWLLQKLWDSAAGPVFDIRPLLETLENKLWQDDGQFHSAFVSALELDKIYGGKDLLNIIYEIGETNKYDLIELAQVSENSVLTAMNELEVQITADALVRTGLLMETAGGLVAEPVAMKAVALCRS